MKIKRYTDVDRRRVMDRIRSEMGPDAIILSSKITDEGFSLVACDLDERLLDQQVAGGKERSLTLVVDQQEQAAVQPDESVSNLQEELNKLRELIEVELPKVARGNSVVAPEPIDLSFSLAARLERFGFSLPFSKTLQSQVGEVSEPQTGWKKALQIVEGRICDHPDAGFNLRGHYALIGPAGSGKTATLCKIATQCQRSLGRDAIGIISVDRKRLGAHQQIGQFAKHMKLSAVSVTSWSDLKRAQQKFADKKLVLIDTPPLQQGDDLGHYLSGLEETGHKVQSLYCFAATSSRELLLEHARIAKASGLSAVVTRADECLSLVPVIEALARTSLPLFFLCDGSSIRRDIRAAKSQEILQLTLKLYRDARAQVRRSNARQELSA